MPTGKSAPMQNLLELISHQCQHKDPIIIPIENSISEKGTDIEDKEEDESDTNMQKISKEVGLSPKMSSKVKKRQEQERDKYYIAYKSANHKSGEIML